MSLPTVSVATGLPLFTIEQIELIRRLRNSGVTKVQIIQAFDSFSRIDSELGNLYTIPQSLASTVTHTQSPPQSQTLQSSQSRTPPQSASQSQTQQSQTLQSASQSRTLQSPPRPQSPQSQSLPPVSQAQTPHPPPQASGPPSQMRKNLSHVCQTAKASSSTEVVRMKKPRMNRQSSAEEDCVIPGNSDVSENWSCDDQESLQLPQNPATHGIDEDLKVRLEDFMKLPAPKRLEEILTMVTVAGVRVQDIAVKTGLTAPTISRFLQGDNVEISTNQRRSIYLWYLMQLQEAEGLYRPPVTSPTLLKQTAQGQRQARGQQVMQVFPSRVTKTEVNPDVSMVDSSFTLVPSDFVPRRERFTFKDKHLEVLDEAFRMNQYPSYEEREEIAFTCNVAMTALSGRELSEREKVTCYIVQNWFQNRRKEIKRLARTEGICCSEVVLPNRPKTRVVQSPGSLDSPFSQVSDETGPAEHDGENGQLDPATINKLLYTAAVGVVKQEPEDSEQSD